MTQYIALYVLISLLAIASAEELTFELPDNEKMCFYEEMEAGVKTTLEFQVIQGGNYDCDMELKDPAGKSLYKDVKKQYDSYTWTTATKGVYEFCFSNEFSTFTHKVIYFDFQKGEEKPIVPGMAHVAAMTMMETSAVTIHESLKTITDYQTHHRLREMHGRSFAENLNTRVMYRSAFEFACILLVSITQVLIVRSFFADKKNRG